MSDSTLRSRKLLERRTLLKLGVASLAATAAPWSRMPRAARAQPAPAQQPTEFQIACMTLCYSQFPLERALQGLQSAGYQYVAWGTTHTEGSGERIPVIAPDASPAKAKELAQRCRDVGLEPLMMFSGVAPDDSNHSEQMQQRILQAEAAGIDQILTFGSTRGGDRQRWIQQFRELAPIAADHGVLIVIKPHGGLTADGKLCLELVDAIDRASVQINYDAGNVMDYLSVDAETIYKDVNACASRVRSFCIKDHRNWPQDQDCGPGYGEIDHYRLLAPVMRTGTKMPLCCENIFAPVVPRPQRAEEVDDLARRARTFLEVVIAGLQGMPG